MIAKLTSRFVSAAVLLEMVQLVSRNVIGAIDRQKLITLSATFYAAGTIVLNFILIPAMSYNGATIATTTISVVFTLSLFYVVSKHLRVISVHKAIIKPIIVASVVRVFAYYVSNFNRIIIVPLAATVCMASVLKMLSEEDMKGLGV